MIGVGTFWPSEVSTRNVWPNDRKGGWLVGYLAFNHSVAENIGSFIHTLFPPEGDNEDTCIQVINFQKTSNNKEKGEKKKKMTNINIYT